MPCCAVLSCRIRSQDLKGTPGMVSFHLFPSDPHLKEKWIKSTGKKDWISTKSSTICSKHFMESDYVPMNNKRRILRPGAIPTQAINLLINQSQPEVIQSEPSCSVPPAALLKRPLEESSSTADMRQKMNHDIPVSNVSTPRKRKLKNITTNKDSLIKKQRLQIRKLQASNRRLKKRVLKLEDILKDLQENFHFRHEDVATLKTTNVKVQELIARYTEKRSEDISRGKYPAALRSFALTLHFYSPKAYEYVRNTFNLCLPHSRTVQKWYENS